MRQNTIEKAISMMDQKIEHDEYRKEAAIKVTESTGMNEGSLFVRKYRQRGW
ncbi:hypothetical protein [uncultured Desulfobacter sp.]|uniref:hypothetical protein n=1 Tax=uncultured Desulfobacter sp. TaxID=240139 RepID=UPI0029F5CA7E|nr:hypothetical protein [uncultured Desulfobacter sp.]